MKKKEMMKQQLKEKQQRRELEKEISTNDFLNSLWKIVLGVGVFILLIITILNIKNGTWNIFSRKNKTEEATHQNVVMCGTLFDKEIDEYLVIAYDFTDEDQKSQLGELSPSKKLFYLDLNSAFNSVCKGDKNSITLDVEKLKIAEPTLIHVKNKSINKTVTGLDQIVDYSNQN